MGAVCTVVLEGGSKPAPLKEPKDAAPAPALDITSRDALQLRVVRCRPPALGRAYLGFRGSVARRRRLCLSSGLPPGWRSPHPSLCEGIAPRGRCCRIRQRTWLAGSKSGRGRRQNDPAATSQTWKSCARRVEDLSPGRCETR